MLSLIEVTCPHCGARGQLMLPPLGALIVGPCPECQGLVVVFCGQVLPLEKDLMLNGSFGEKRDHLMGVLTSFLEDRIVQLLKETSSSEEACQEAAPDGGESGLEGMARETHLKDRGNGDDLITEVEMADFVRVDLNLIDNTDYFNAIFG